MIEIPINTDSLDDYQTFLKCKKLPKYEVKGNKIITDELSYNSIFGDGKLKSVEFNLDKYSRKPFDYQSYIVNKSLEKKRFAPYLDCGLGKSTIELIFADSIPGKTLIQCPLAVLDDMIQEAKVLGIPISNLRKNSEWKEKIAIINFEARKAIDMRDVLGFVLDEASILKNGDGEIRKYLTDLVANCEYRMAGSATPSPNDQSEYATQAVFLGISNTIKEFYSRFFRKDGTDWNLKPHAIDSFYDHVAQWGCYIKSPSKLGFQKGGELEEEPDYHVLSTADNRYNPNCRLFSDSITLQEATKLFGELRSDPKSDRFKAGIDSVKDYQSIVWCKRNEEEKLYHKTLKDSILITGDTPYEKRIELVNEFRKGNVQYLISKPKILGFGINIPQAEAHLYSGYDYSFEQFYQAIRRSHRYGRLGRLKVFIPVAEPEKPIWDILKSKIRTFDYDCEELQKRFFKDMIIK